MAKNGKRYGVCENFENCSKAKASEKIEMDELDDFICPECHSDLREVQEKKGSNWKLIACIIVVVIILGGAIALLFIPSTPKIEGLVLNASTQTMLVGDQNTLVVTNNPIDAPATYVWSTSNPAVLEVSNGQVTAIAPGEATVTVVANENGDAVAMCQYVVNAPVVEVPVEEVEEVTEEPAKPGEPVKVDDGNTNGKVNLGYAIYDGPRQNGKPHGMGGTLTFTTSYQIDLKKMPAEYVNVRKGDYISNTKFINGRLVQGQIHFTNGTQKWINI